MFCCFFVLLFSLRTDLVTGTLQFFSQIVLGEHEVGRDPDCNGGGGKRKKAKKPVGRVKISIQSVKSRYVQVNIN